MFAEQRLAGVNPMTLMKVTKDTGKSITFIKNASKPIGVNKTSK